MKLYYLKFKTNKENGRKENIRATGSNRDNGSGDDPGIETASLYEVIDKEHDGTINDPIPHTPPMEIFNSKYCTQNSVLYRCTRDSGQALTHNLADLVGTYVEVVER